METPTFFRIAVFIASFRCWRSASGQDQRIIVAYTGATVVITCVDNRRILCSAVSGWRHNALRGPYLNYKDQNLEKTEIDGTCSLRISSINAANSGFYLCIVKNESAVNRIDVITIESEPTCNILTSTNLRHQSGPSSENTTVSVVLTEEEEFNATCSFKFSGPEITANINLVCIHNQHAVNDSCELDDQIRERTKTLGKSVQQLNPVTNFTTVTSVGLSKICAPLIIRGNGKQYDRQLSEELKLLTSTTRQFRFSLELSRTYGEVALFVYNWTSPPINLLHGVKEIKILLQQTNDNRSIRTSIRCFAEGNPPASYEWIEIESNKSLGTMATMPMERLRGIFYQCVATNNVNGHTYVAKSSPLNIENTVQASATMADAKTGPDYVLLAAILLAVILVSSLAGHVLQYYTRQDRKCITVTDHHYEVSCATKQVISSSSEISAANNGKTYTKIQLREQNEPERKQLKPSDVSLTTESYERNTSVVYDEIINEQINSVNEHNESRERYPPITAY